MSLAVAHGWIEQAERIVGFTGAGISTESGIPDFRSPDGVWSKRRMIYFDEFVSNEADRVEYWSQKMVSWPEMRKAQPNAGHHAFVELFRRGKLRALVTQNIERLHQKAGLPNDIVHELHGTTTEAACLSCGDRISSDEACARVAAGEKAPRCRLCDGLLKPATISFGQSMPVDVMRQAEEAALDCDLMIAVGSSLVVQPAASIPVVAKRAGAKLMILNREETPLDEIADLVIHDEIGRALSAMVDSAS